MKELVEGFTRLGNGSTRTSISHSLILIIILAFTGSIVKIYGGIVYGSRAIFVDALTSFANLVSLLAIIRYYILSLQPPDHDHPYGHYRLGYIGVLVSLVAYGYVAGLSSMELIYTTSYTVYLESVYYAITGFILYGLAIILSLRIGGFFEAYGLFTISELYESIVTILASLAGALYSYLIDYAGAIGLTLYIFYELVVIGREIAYIITDQSPPLDIVENIKRYIESSGYQVLNLRIRCIAPNIYQGDAIIEVIDKGRAVNLVELKKKLLKKYKLDIVFELYNS
jgi:cobalt-zinc-cadmium efflux system protein